MENPILVFKRGWHFRLGNIYIFIAEQPDIHEDEMKKTYECHVIYGNNKAEIKGFVMQFSCSKNDFVIFQKEYPDFLLNQAIRWAEEKIQSILIDFIKAGKLDESQTREINYQITDKRELLEMYLNPDFKKEYRRILGSIAQNTKNREFKEEINKWLTSHLELNNDDAIEY